MVYREDFPDGHWARHLRTADPEAPLVPPKPKADIEGQDEQQWGQQRVLHFVTGGTGPTALTAPQLIQATRPARVWSATLAFGVAVADVTQVQAPNSTVTVTFILLLGLGQTQVTRYVQLFSTDLVAFAPDPSFPTRVQPPIASTTLVNLPAKTFIVSAHVRYDRILIGAPANLDVSVSAEVAPVFR